MALEIERKFLVSSDAWRAQASRVIPMAQGYLNDQASMDSGAQRVSVRVRLEGDDARLNLKSREVGHTRQEFDYPIPIADARALLARCVGGLIDKHRHLVEHADHLWEVDEFFGDNAGLIVAEIELDSGDEVWNLVNLLVWHDVWFERPAWLGMEVTDSPRYYNLALASRPYSQWSEAERAASDLESSPCL